MFSLLFGSMIFLCLLGVMWFFVSSFFKKKSFVVINWVSPYECGFSSSSFSFKCFSFSYFSLLVFFVMFDLEISLLLNMPEQGLLFEKFYFYYLFLLILMTGFLVEILLGYVRWGY